MFTKQKQQRIAKHNQRLGIKLAIIYLLLILLFIFLIVLI